MTQRNLRGMYYVPTHDRAEDWQFLRDWQPSVVRLMVHGSHSDPASVDVARIRRVHETCPEATILLRCWDVDDRNFEAHAAMVANPNAEANKQIDWWAKLFARIDNIPHDKLMAGLNNETGPEKDGPLYQYTAQALRRGTELGIRLGGLVFSVGRPSLPGESEFDINFFSRLEPLFLAGNHAMILHEYMQPEGRKAVWTDQAGNERSDYSYLIGRHKRWPVRVPMIIGEWGIDGLLYNRHPHPEFGNSGWRNFPTLWSADRYADEYVDCVREASDNVIAICPFLTDFADRKWASFDTLEAHAALIARKDLCVKDVGETPHDIHLPQIELGTPPVVATPPVPSEAKPPQPQEKPMSTGIIEPRVAQAILKVESGSRTHGDDGRMIIRFEAHIFKRYFGNDARFDQHFRYDQARPWVNQQWRRTPNDTWKMIHTGLQSDEWTVFEFANTQLSTPASFMAISMGAGQIMGFNHARIGYPSAAAMYSAFRDPQLQTIGLINFCLSDAQLADAMRRKDWRTIAKLYNGSGAVDTYAPLLEQAYKGLAGG